MRRDTGKALGAFVCPILVACSFASPAFAIDIGAGNDGVILLPGALDQPKINVYVTRTDGGSPIHFDEEDPSQYIFNAFLDTGASFHLMSNETAGTLPGDPDPVDGLEIVRDEFGGETIVFQDAGAGGTVDFHVSEPLFYNLAPHTQDTSLAFPGDPTGWPTLPDFSPIAGVQRTQIGPVVRPVFGDPTQGLDVIGMPAMVNKVVVMDGRGLNQFATTQDLFDYDVMDTFIYNPGTPFDPVDAAVPQLSKNPGIPEVEHHIALSYANFGPFTTTTPDGAPSPTLASNPFIGLDPVRVAMGDAQPDVPGIKVSFDGNSAEGSFLLDTGAGASFIGETMAGNLDVFYDYANGRGPGDPEDGADPLLVNSLGEEIENQFQLGIAAFGADDPGDPDDSSTIVISGFYVDAMLVRTILGDPVDDEDEAHLNFLEVPVLVFDVGIAAIIEGELVEVTLDGIFGMNLLAASAIPPESIFDPFVTSKGAFDWIVFNESEGWLGVGSVVPEPASLGLLGLAGLTLLRRRRTA